jgi:serine/threonine-protein kinase
VTPDPLVDEIARAVLDGEPVDWPAAESNGGPALERIKHLRTVAALAQAHRIERWGHLKILDVLGRGSSGTVYRAWDTRLDREVALKLVPSGPEPAGAASAMIHEGRLLARVQHPNVVIIHGADRLDGYVGLWMELVRGRTLEEFLRDGVTFTAKDVMRVGVGVCHALAAVHAAGLLHRDVKAQNVMRADEGRIVLMDFGTGRDVGDTGSDLAGTPLYLAPELFRGDAATPQSDIYSLGVLLYRLLTGSYPVQGKTVEDVRNAHISGARVVVDALPAPRRLQRMIARAIDSRPDMRYPTADAFHADLEKAAHALARRRWIWGGAALLTLLLSAGWLASESGWMTGRPGTNAVASSIMSAVGIPPPAVLPAGERPVIAVAPFRSASNDADTALIAEGLTYEIVRSLAGLEGLDVRSAGSSLASGARAADASVFGGRLGANLVLEGSVQRSSSGFRVHAQLIRVADHAAVLPVSIESADNDLLAVQERLSLAVVNRLRLYGLGQRRYQLDPRLSELFFTARALQARRRTDNAARAVELFAQIIAADPSFAPAHAGLASALGAFSGATPSVEAPPPDPRMGPAALRAIELDPFLAEAHASVGSLYARDRDWGRARASFLRAIELDPTLTSAHSEFVLMVLLPRGELDEALRVIAAAQRTDPMSLDVRRVMALVQVDSGRYAEAIESARWVVDRDPKFPFADLWLGRALLLAGRPDEAAPILADKHWGYRGYLYAVTGRRAEAEALAKARPNDPAGQMLVYGGLGDADRAYEALERVAQLHWWRAATWMLRPELSVLRDDPRLAALRARMGLPR